MKKIVRRIAVLIGAVAVSAGLIGATATPSEAKPAPHSMDSQWN
jgi:hypothetical protein